jgi:hypothetical protein
MAVRGLLLAGILVGVSTAAAAVSMLPNRPGQFAPQDSCRSDPTITRFINRVEQAQSARDVAQLKALSTSEVTSSFGGESGPDALAEEFTANPEAWNQLGKLLKLGCQRDGSTIMLPWFFSLDFGNADMTVIMLAAGPDVPLYLNGDRKSPVLRRLNWQLVTTTDKFSADSSLQRVRVVGTRDAGWVEVGRLRSQTDYRLVAAREDGEWKISAFVVGD